jgi:hypothetical protein
MNDNNPSDETTYYRYIRRLDGSLEAIDFVKQGDRLVPRFTPESRKEEPTRRIADFLRFYREIMYGLSRPERRTWLTLLMGSTIEDLALSEGVSRPAIYARIRGNKGRGGMIRKNVFVLAWWLVGKKKRNQHE